MEKIIILGHENPDVDSIVSGYILEKILKIKGYNVEFVIPEETIEEESLDICRKNGLDPTKFMKSINLNDKAIKYILVDHNERQLGGEVVCIIDHHPTRKKIDIKKYYNKNISSTALYICSGNEHLLEKRDLYLVILATMVDTASFHSTKGRPIDKDWVITLCNKYEFDYDALYRQGLCLTKLDNVEKASFNGIKKYNFNQKRVECSYIQIENPLDKKDKIDQILNILKKYVKKEKLDAFIFIIHDMKKFKTMYYLIRETVVEVKYYEQYTSRGTTIMPEIEKKYYYNEKKL